MTQKTSPIHDARPNVASPDTLPGEHPLEGDGDACARSSNSASSTPHSPRRDGDNSGGQSTASERGSADKGHQHTPRPGDHQGGH